MATHDVELVEFFFAHTVAPALVAVLVPALVFGTLLAFGWPMAAALLPFLLIVVLSPFFMRARIDALGSRAREALAGLNAHVVDTIQGLNEIIAFEHVGQRKQEMIARTKRNLSLRLPFFRDLTIQMALLEVATGLGGLSSVFTGARLVAAGELSAGMLPLLTLLAMAAFLPVSEIAHIGRQLADTLGATRRLYAVHNEEVAVTDGGGVSLPEARGGASLEFSDVDFSYFSDGRLALGGASFSAPAGSTVALVGSSGAGKTTAAHLLMRFFDPQKGEVRLNGTSLRDFKLDALRRQIALVTQDTYLFNETLRANILLARPDAGEQDIRQAVERAALAEFVDALPEGLETRVGERGVRLSGGQRQRVAIARAFLKDAPVLILDEATSHLDAVSEQAVRSSLEKLMTDRTTVVIAHRLSTIRNADLIVVLDAGHVAEQEGARAVALHARTAAQLYHGNADWNAIAELKRSVGTIPVLGNGDIWESYDALRMMRATGCDGVTVGRGCLGRPWLFGDLLDALSGREVRPSRGLGEVMDVMLDHARLLAVHMGEGHAMRDFRKHTGWYMSGYPVGPEARRHFSGVKTLMELEDVLAGLDQRAEIVDGGEHVKRGHTNGPIKVSLPNGWLDAHHTDPTGLHGRLTDDASVPDDGHVLALSGG